MTEILSRSPLREIQQKMAHPGTVYSAQKRSKLEGGEGGGGFEAESPWTTSFTSSMQSQEPPLERIQKKRNRQDQTCGPQFGSFSSLSSSSSLESSLKAVQQQNVVYLQEVLRLRKLVEEAEAAHRSQEDENKILKRAVTIQNGRLKEMTAQSGALAAENQELHRNLLQAGAIIQHMHATIEELQAQQQQAKARITSASPFPFSNSFGHFQPPPPPPDVF